MGSWYLSIYLSIYIYMIYDWGFFLATDIIFADERFVFLKRNLWEDLL